MKTHTSTARYFSVGHRLILGALIASMSWQTQAACTFFDNFKDNRDGTVTDPRNGLIWKRCAEGFTWNGSACDAQNFHKDPEKRMRWFEAMREAKDSRFLGKADWRIPTKTEFAAVVGKYDDCKENDFKNGEYAASKDIAHPVNSSGYPGGFWSSSPLVGKSNAAWYVNFHNGNVVNFHHELNTHVRLVRSSQTSGGKAALEFNNEYQKVREYEREQAAQARAQQDQERRDAQAREQAAATACSRFSPGDTGTVRGPSRLSSDVNYVTRYVNASKGTITIEATSSGQLNMSRGEMRQVNCSEVGSDGRIEIYYK